MKKKKKSKDTMQQNLIIRQGGGETKDSFIYWLAFVGLWGLIFLPPFFRGLFFSTEQFAALIFSTLIFSLWWVFAVKTEGADILNNPMDWVVLGLLLSYIIAFFGAVNQKLAVVEIIKHILYFNVFWLASRLVVDDKSIQSILNVIILSAIGVAMAGIFTAMGWIHILDGFIENRIASTFQYHNALASYLLATFTLALAMWLSAKKHYKYIYIIFAYIMLVVFLGTNSRGAFLFLPVVFILTLANPWLKNRLEVFIFWIIVLMGTVLANNGLIPNIVNDKIVSAWMWFFIGIAVVTGGQFVVEKLKERDILRESLPQTKILLVVLIVLIALVGVSWQYILPDHLVDRIKSISLAEANVGERFYWALEAFKMAKESPLFGLGGGAWEASHRYFQGYYYQSTQVHNHFAQTLMEVGYVGLTFFISLWLVTIYLAYKNFRVADGKLRDLQWFVLVAVLSLGGHAFIDFDLALSAITIVLFVLFGITVGIYRINYPLKIWFKGKGVPVLVLTTLIVLTQIGLTGSLIVGSKYAGNAIQAANSNNMQDAIGYFNKAKTYDPFTSSYWADLARFYERDGNPELAVEYIEEAKKRDRYNWRIYQSAAQLYWNMGQYEKAVENMELARDYNRWHQETWEKLSQTYFAAGVSLLQDNNYELAAEYFRRVSHMPDDIEARLATLNETEERLWRTNWGGHWLTVSPDIYLYSGVGNYFLDDLGTAEKYFAKALEGENLEALWWMALVKLKQGFEKEAVVFYERAQAGHPEFENNFWAIRNLQEDWWNR